MAAVASCARWLLACALAFAVLPPVAAAKDRARLDEPFEITADRIDYDGRKQLYVATGRVRVQQVDRSLRADWVAFSTETRIGVAEGGVELVDEGDVVQAEFMVFDVDSLRGMFFEGGLDAGSQGFKVRAKEMVRTGENTFRLTDGVFTSCRCPEGERPPWEISTSEASVEVGDYGTIRNATFDVLGVPILWVPWAFFPVKSDRETGLLLPQIGLGGRSGFGGGLPFFWAAHPQVNVILTPFYYTERGFKGNADVEYVFGEKSGGELLVSGLHDRRVEPSGATQSDRWGVHWDHDQELPAEWRWQTDLNLNSDNFYSDDFNEFSRYRNVRYMESTTSLNNSFGASGGFGVMLGARFADDVQGLEIRGKTFFDTDDLILQRLGEFQADVQPGAAVMPGGIEARLDTDVIHFRSLRNPDDRYQAFGANQSASDGRFYDVGIDATLAAPLVGQPVVGGQGNGVFDPGEVIADRGLRAVLHPRLARPFEIANAVEVVPEVGWRQYLYSTSEARFAERGMLTARVDARSRLARDYELGAEGQGTLRHVLEPRLGWAFVSPRASDRNPAGRPSTPLTPPPSILPVSGAVLDASRLDLPLFIPNARVAQSRLRSLSMESLTRSPTDRMETTNRVLLGLGQRFYTRDRARGPLALKADVQTAIDWDFTEQRIGAAYLDARLLGVGPLGARLVAAFDPSPGRLDEGGVELTFQESVDWGLLQDVMVKGGYRYRQQLPTFLESNRGEARISTTNSVNQLNLLVQLRTSLRVQLRYSTIYKLADENEFLRNQGTVEYVSKCGCWAVGATVAFDRRDDVSGGFSIRFMGLGDGEDSIFGRGFGSGMNF